MEEVQCQLCLWEETIPEVQGEVIVSATNSSNEMILKVWMACSVAL